MRDERRKNILDFIWWIKKVVVLLSLGEVAEWSIAAVLKTVELRGSGGSNPSLSADFDAEQMTFQPSVFVFGIMLCGQAHSNTQKQNRQWRLLCISL